MNSVFVVFDNCEPDAKIIAVAVSLESAIEATRNKSNYYLNRRNAVLSCRWNDSWRYEIENRAFLIVKHPLYSI